MIKCNEDATGFIGRMEKKENTGFLNLVMLKSILHIHITSHEYMVIDCVEEQKQLKHRKKIIIFSLCD